MVYLHGLTYSLGQVRKTVDLDLDRVSKIELLAKGVEGYRKAELGLIDTAVKVARDCLKKSGVALESVDMVLFGSNSLSAPEAAHDIGHSLVTILGLKRAHAQLVGFQNCGDSVPILRTAQAMVRSGMAKNVLIVMADDTDAASLPRVVGSNSYLHSDGASACLVNERVGQFELVDSAVRHIDVDTGFDFDPMDLETHLQTLLQEAREFLLQGGSIDLEDRRTLVLTHNMNRLFHVRVAQALGVPSDRVFAQPGLGHCMASDALINLAKVANDRQLPDGSACAVVVPTRRSVGVLTLKYVGSVAFAPSDDDADLALPYEQGVRESMSVLPNWLQPMLSTLTGKPLKGQVSSNLGPLGFLIASVTWLCISVALPLVGLSSGFEPPWLAASAIFLPLFWLVAAGQMRKLQVVVGHHCVHRVFIRGRPRLNDGLLETISTLLLVQSASEYRRDHLGHHSRALFTTREDADAAFLYKLGFRPGMPVAASWRLLWVTLFSPRFHGIFLKARLLSVLGKQRSAFWRVVTVTWIIGLFVGLPLFFGLGPVAVAVWMPLIFCYQGSALLQFLTEHAWLRSGQAPEGTVAYAERCWGRFLGERCPPHSGTLTTRTLSWLRWWTRLLLVHAPVRISCLVGDLPAHDWHHLCGFLGGDPARWTHSLFDRQAAIDSVPAHPLAQQMARQELWGLASMLSHVFTLLSTAQISNKDKVVASRDVVVHEVVKEVSKTTINSHHEESELHSTT